MSVLWSWCWIYRLEKERGFREGRGRPRTPHRLGEWSDGCPGPGGVHWGRVPTVHRNTARLPCLVVLGPHRGFVFGVRKIRLESDLRGVGHGTTTTLHVVVVSGTSSFPTQCGE